jgi:hypothetical protein
MQCKWIKKYNMAYILTIWGVVDLHIQFQIMMNQTYAADTPFYSPDGNCSNIIKMPIEYWYRNIYFNKIWLCSNLQK